jgi:spermidine synthase
MSSETVKEPLVGADGWYRETSTMWPGQAMAYKVEAVLHREQTQFQDLAILKTDAWGSMMTLDGAVQLTDRDEFVYHEMMAHLAMRAHGNPRHVLIIGGGDGGVLREVLKYTSVELCTLVDIDGAVIEAAKKYFPNVSCGFADARARTIVGDGAAFVANSPADAYDVIICDSSDPEGPASALFGKEFYAGVLRALRRDGVVCSQGESIWLHEKLIASMASMMRGSEVGFAVVQYAMIYIPSYPCGSIGALMGRKESTRSMSAAPGAPLSVCLRDGEAERLRYYSPEMHEAAFTLPAFAAYINS